jgi:hypothetical protein
MIHLGTLVLSRDARHLAAVGAFLHKPDWPTWNTTAAYDGVPGIIRGATLIDADDLGQQALAVVVVNREKAPLICSEETRVFSIDREGWVPASNLKHGETLRIPEISKLGLLPTWGKVKRVARAPLPERLFLDANRMWGTLVLQRGAWSFATPGCWVHV